MSYDVAGPGLIGVIGWAGFLLVSPLIVLVEAVVLWVLKWKPLGRSLLEALLMNLASTLVGACALGAGLLLLTPETLWISLGVGFGLSVFIEAAVLWLLQRRAAAADRPPLARLAAVTLAANLVSYAGLAGLASLVFNGL